MLKLLGYVVFIIFEAAAAAAPTVPVTTSAHFPEAGEYVQNATLQPTRLEGARRLGLAEFTSWSLTKPLSSNLLTWTEVVDVLDARAGAPYYAIQLHATSNLGTDPASVRIKLMLSDVDTDADCVPGSEYEAPHIVTAYSPPTPLDGVTPGSPPPGRDYENIWLGIRFPYSGIFEMCYFNGASGAIWQHVPGQFTVNGADSNVKKHWCVASPDVECRTVISGRNVRESWRFTLVEYDETCGAGQNYSTAFTLSTSTTNRDLDDDTIVYHEIGRKQSTDYSTFKVCYCPGYNHVRLVLVDYLDEICQEPEDYVQLAGLLFATRAIPIQEIYPMLRFDLVVHCGAENAGGCPFSTEPRFRLVEPAFLNNRPSYDPDSGCRTAPQIANFFLPQNCVTPTHCLFLPSVVSTSTPQWSGVRLLTVFNNHAQEPRSYDVCFCYQACIEAENWFKVDQVTTSMIQVLPDPIVANHLTDLQLYGPNGGWALAGDVHTRELKLLFDPEGTVSSANCFADPQDVRAIVGHFCYSTTDCKSPSVSTTDGHTWANVRVHYAGMYAVCYCDEKCTDPERWSFLKWHLVAGSYDSHSWQFSRGIYFDLRITGWGLGTSNRLQIIDPRRGYDCGEPTTVPAYGVELPSSAPPLQLEDIGPFGVLTMVYTFDGILLTLGIDHTFSPEEYISLSNITSVNCPHCAELLNGRPHKVVRVPADRQVVIPVFYAERAFPRFDTDFSSWRRSSEVTFQNVRGLLPATYKVCWGRDLPEKASDFSGTAGQLRIFEPPVFQVSLHLTSIEAEVVASAIIAFETRNDPKYASAQGEMQLKILFHDFTRLSPGFSIGESSEVRREDAWQHLCSGMFRELWSPDPDGFPMPKGCFYHYDDARKEFGMLFSARNGLKASTHYQIVMDVRSHATTSASGPPPTDGVLQLWSMDEVDANPFGVVEFGPASPDQAAVTGASTAGSRPKFHAVDGFKILSDDADAELTTLEPWTLRIRMRAAAGSPVVSGTLLRVFLFPLTQWSAAESCLAGCAAHTEMVTGLDGSSVETALTCPSPTCHPEALVSAPTGSRRNLVKLAFLQMDPITDTVMHTILLSQLTLPAGGFFPTALAAELQAYEGAWPSYVQSTGALLYVRPSAIGSVLSGSGDGDQRPFRSDQGNILYVKLVLGATLWAAADDDAGFDIVLPGGYLCINAKAAEANLTALEALGAPQGRGEIGRIDYDAEGRNETIDGHWLFSGATCGYFLRRDAIIYAGSSIFVRLTVNNPVFALPRTDSSNVWTLQTRGKAAPFSYTAETQKTSNVANFQDRGTYLRRNTPVLGKLTEAILTPTLLGLGQNRNWLSVFFTTEQGSPGTAPRLELRVPQGFGLLPRCVVEPLPLYHYSSMSSLQTGRTTRTHDPQIVRCEASRQASNSNLLDLATMAISRYAELRAMTTYGFRIMVFNPEAYDTSQHDGFRLTTRSTVGDGLDGSFNTLRFLASDGDGPGTSFGVYRLPMPSGMFVATLANMLPYSETGIASTIIIFPLRVPFDSLTAVDWRLIAPHGYEWSFTVEEFQWRMQNILGASADLPIAFQPAPPAVPPKNILDFAGNAHGSWDQMQAYGLVTRIRVPDATPRSSTNAFFVEFGYSAETQNQRLAAASYDAPEVRAIINAVVDYAQTNLAGQQSQLLIQMETITNLPNAGGFRIEAPQGFVFEESCVVLPSPMRETRYSDLATAASITCSSLVPYTTNRPLVTITVVDGQVNAAWYEFMLDVRNPTTTQEQAAMVWSIFAYLNLELQDPADLAASLDGFPIEEPMALGEIVTAGVSYSKTQRDDHPGMRSFVVLAFETSFLPPVEEQADIIVKAPLGYVLPTICSAVVGLDTFGASESYPAGYYPFETTTTVVACEGRANSARIRVANGVFAPRRTYALRLEIFNPTVTPDYNRWTISYVGQSTMPFNGYRLWSFTEVQVSASHGARSTEAEETKNVVTIRFRPTNAILSTGVLALAAPFNFRIATQCVANMHRLNSLGTPVANVEPIICQGAPQPTNTVDIFIADPDVQIAGLELYNLELEVVNPRAIPIDPGVWRLQSYSTRESAYTDLLDLGEAASFPVTEVFVSFQVTYSPTINALSGDTIGLSFAFILPHAVTLGDVLEVHGPSGYDFAVPATTAQLGAEFRSCRAYSGISPEELPLPTCLTNAIRFTFSSGGIALSPKSGTTPVIAFSIETAYPRLTLAVQTNVFHGEHLRGTSDGTLSLLSSKTVLAMTIEPRLRNLAVTRLDSMIAVRSTSTLQVSFQPSQEASALRVTTLSSQGEVQDPVRRFNFAEVEVSAAAEGLPVGSITLVEKTNETVIVELGLRDHLVYAVTLTGVINPQFPGQSLWTLSTYARPAELPSAGHWSVQENLRDLSQYYVGPATYSRIEIDQAGTTLAGPYFDMDGTELLMAFQVYPTAIPSGQYVILYAPYGYSFVDRTFSTEAGFPLVSGSVYARAPTSTDGYSVESLWAYVIQILTRIRPNQIVRFGVRVNTPRTPQDMTQFESDHSSAWRLVAAHDAAGTQQFTASNDALFAGFTLQASFGTATVEPEPNGIAPRARVTVTLTMVPRTSLSSLLHSGGSIHVRVVAPLGFDFDAGCLAVTPNPVFELCAGNGRVAVLQARDALLPAGRITVVLGISNARITPPSNVWQLESFVDLPIQSIEGTTLRPRQRSNVEGYTIRELLQATIGADTQLGAVTTVFVWFVATHFLDLGGVVELHAPMNYQLRCTPRIQYISLPAGSCQLHMGTTSSTGDQYHHYVGLTLTVAEQLVQPNTAYEFGVSAVNPTSAPQPNFWGLTLVNPRGEVLDASMMLDGYVLTDYRLSVQVLLPSSTMPTVVNYVRLELAFGRELLAGSVSHLTVRAPATTKVLCQQFSDVSGGGSGRSKLPLDQAFGTYGTHTCQLQNTITLHFQTDVPVLAQSYNLQIGVLNPGIRAAKDYWSVELIGGEYIPSTVSVNDSSNLSSAMLQVGMINATIGWRTAEPALRVQVPGFGISSAFAGTTVAPLLSSAEKWSMLGGPTAMVPAALALLALPTRRARA